MLPTRNPRFAFKISGLRSVAWRSVLQLLGMFHPCQIEDCMTNKWNADSGRELLERYSGLWSVGHRSRQEQGQTLGCISDIVFLLPTTLLFVSLRHLHSFL